MGPFIFLWVGGGGGGGFLIISEKFCMTPLQFSFECPIKPVHLPVKNLFSLQLLGCPPPLKLEKFSDVSPPLPTHKKWPVPKVYKAVAYNHQDRALSLTWDSYLFITERFLRFLTNVSFISHSYQARSQPVFSGKPEGPFCLSCTFIFRNERN